MTQPKWPEMDNSKKRLLRKSLSNSIKASSTVGPSTLMRQNAYDCARDGIIECFIKHGDKTEEELERLINASIRNGIRDSLRRQKSRDNRISAFEQIPIDERSDSSLYTDEILILKEDEELSNQRENLLIVFVINAVGEKDAQIIFMDAQDLTDKEIAKNVNRNESWVKVRKHRVRKKLKTQRDELERIMIER